MELNDLVESSNQQHPSVAQIRVEVAGDNSDSKYSSDKEESFLLSVDLHTSKLP
jgi:hypothetical protein